MSGAGRGLALIALIALAAFAALLFGGRAGAETHGAACLNGYWVHTVDGDLSGYPGSRSGIPCDEAKPAWLFSIHNPGNIVWVYDGDRVPTPYTNPGSDVVHLATREIQPQGNLRPPVNQPVQESSYIFIADANNRAVRGEDGDCYREQRVNGQWKRSASYGSDNQSCLKARWNAYFRSQDRSLIGADRPADRSLLPVGLPPDHATLVDNILHPAQTTGFGGTARDHAQAFTTGDSRNGYNITEVRLFFEITSPAGVSPTTAVEIWSSSQGGRPGSRLATLSSPSALVQGFNSFSGSGIRLQPGTTYFVVLDWAPDGSSGPRFIQTVSDEEVGASGWSLSDGSLYREQGETAWSDNSDAYRVTVRGMPR